MNKKGMISFAAVLLLAGIWLAINYDIETYFLPANAQLPDGGSYYGELEDNLFSGKGKIKWPNGASYHGQFEHGLFSGLGNLVSANGDQYKGYFQQGQYQGEGTLNFADGGIYKGSFDGGKYHGEGELQDIDGGVYSGQFNNGEFHGQGKYITDYDYSYQGQFFESAFTGKGKYEDSDGNVYDGEFKNWLFDGEGVYIAANGDIYQGSFSEGELIGEADFKGQDGSVYTGEFEYWQFNGKGDLVSANGDHYQGDFDYGQYHGIGTLITNESEQTGKWKYGNYTGDGSEPSLEKRNVEKVLYNQNQLINDTLANISPTDTDKINLYFVGIAGYGEQDVFYKEIMTVQQIFAQSFATEGRSAILVNNPETVDSFPLATTTALEVVLQGISEKMDKDNDILFLYLTSHGSKDHKFSFNQQGLDLADLPAKKLAEIVNSLPIKWKVIVVSACYSGGFIEPLDDQNTMVITAAASKRTSFGCSEDADMTYFGRAFFEDAIPETNSFSSAFEKATELVSERESEEGIVLWKHSNPQISKPEPIIAYLKQWRSQLKPE